MLRVTTWRLNPNAPADTTPAAGIQAFNEFAAALNRVRGVSNARWFSGNGGIVTAGDIQNYAAADAILADPGLQAAGAKVISLGYGIAEDLFLLEPQQVRPFMAES